MHPTLIQLSAIIYLVGALLTSLPVTVGLLGWCPCGCLPSALVYPSADDKNDSASGSDHHDHDCSHCRGHSTITYCSTMVELPLIDCFDCGTLALDTDHQLPAGDLVPPIRPPRC